MIQLRSATSGALCQTVEAVDFTFPALAPGQYNFDIPVQSPLTGHPMCLVSFDNFDFQLIVLGQGLIATGLVRLNVLYLVALAVPRQVDMHVMLSLHDWDPTA